MNNPELSLPKGDDELKSAEDLAIEFGEEMLSNLRVNVAADKERRSKLPKPEDDPCEWNGRILSKFHDFVDFPGGHRCIKCKKEYQGAIAERKPEDEVTLPALSESAIAHMQGEDHNYGTAFRDRERQLLSTLRKLSTTERELEGMRADHAAMSEGLWKTLQENLLLELAIVDLKAGETASDAWERGQLSMRSRINTIMQTHGLGLIGIELSPYTSPLKVGSE